MSARKIIIDEYRVGDTKPDFTVIFEQEDLTGYTFKMIYKRQNANDIEIAGVITQTGDGGDVPGIVEFPFSTADHTEGMNTGIIEWDDGSGGIESLDASYIFDIGKK